MSDPILFLLIGGTVGGVCGLAGGLALAHKAPVMDEIELPTWDVQTSKAAEPLVSLPTFVTQPTISATDDAFLIVSDAHDVAFPEEGDDPTDARRVSQVWDDVRKNPKGQQWTLYHGHRIRGRAGQVS